MPRKKQRFNKLFDELRGTGGTPTGTGRTAEFFKYLTGQKQLTQDNKVPVEARQLYEIALLPFALSADNNTPPNRYKANISLYSITGLNSRANAEEADFGIYRIVGGEKEDENYFPALIKAKYDSAGSTVQENKPSGITGDTYRYKYGRTFSFPFGRTTEAIDVGNGQQETVASNQRISWASGGFLSQVYQFSEFEITSSQYFVVLNQINLIRVNRPEPIPYRLVYDPPKYFRDATVKVWQYNGIQTDVLLQDIARTLQNIEVTANVDLSQVDSKLDEILANQQGNVAVDLSEVNNKLDTILNKLYSLPCNDKPDDTSYTQKFFLFN